MKISLTEKQLRQYVDKKVKQMLAEQDMSLPFMSDQGPELDSLGGLPPEDVMSMEPDPIPMRKTAYGRVVDLSKFDTFGKAFAHAKNVLKQKYFYWDRGANDGRKYTVFNTGISQKEKFDPKAFQRALDSFTDSDIGQNLYKDTPLHRDFGVADSDTPPMMESRRRKRRLVKK